MNKEKAIARINKYGNIGKIVTLIFMIVAILGVVGTLIAGIVLLNVPEDLVVFNFDGTARLMINAEEFDSDMAEEDKEMILNAFNSPFHTGLNLGAVSFDLDEAEFVDGQFIASSTGNSENIPLSKLGYAVLTVVVALILTAISLAFASRLCGAFAKCESPFDENVIKKLQQFAYALLPWALFSSVPDSVLNSVLNSSLNISLSLDLNVVFTVLVILALSTIFKYGAELQRESDETL